MPCLDDYCPKHITGNFTASNKQYDGDSTATVLTRTLNGVVGLDVVTLSGGTATFNNENVGTGKTVTLAGATLTGANAGNYVLDSVAPTTADITAKNLTINGAVANNKEYNGDDTATVDFGAAALVGVIGRYGDDDWSGIAATFDDKNVGNGSRSRSAG